MSPTTRCIVCLLSALSAVTAPAIAQSESELRNENQVLKTQVRELTVELKAARETIQQLRDEIAALRAQLAARPAGTVPSTGTPPPEPEPEVVTIDESVPNASPRALLAALRDNYRERFESMEIGDGPGRERSIYLRAVENWQRGASREYRAKIEWHVRAIEVSPRGSVRMVAVDPETDVRLGEPFTVYLRRAILNHFDAMRQRAGDQVYLLRGVLQPEVNIRPDLEKQPTFGETTFIGPFAEFAFTVDVQSLTAAEPPAGPDRDDMPTSTPPRDRP